MKKKKVSNGIYRGSDGVYQISWYVAGVRKWQTIHSRSLKDVRNIRNQHLIEAENIKGSTVALLTKDANLEDIWKSIEEGCVASGNMPKTIGEYKKHYWRFFKEFPQSKGFIIKRPSELNVAYLKRYFNWYVNDYGAKENPYSEEVTIRNILGKVRQLGFLSKEIFEDMKGSLRLRRNEDDSYKEVSNAKLRSMFEYMKDDSSSYFDFFTFLANTGRRPMEVASMLVKDIDWAGINNPLRVGIRASTAKNRKNDQIYLHQTRDITLKAVIINAFNRSNLFQSPYLFCNKDGKKISSTNQEVYIKKISRKVLGFPLSAKYFRKRYVTLCGVAKVPVKDAMLRSGHRDVEVFVTHYQQPTPDGMSAVVDAIDYNGDK